MNKKMVVSQPVLPTRAAKDVASIRLNLPKALRKKLANEPTHNDLKMAIEFLKLYDPVCQPVAVAQDLEPEKSEEDENAIDGEAVVEEEPVKEEPKSAYEDVLSKLPFQDEPEPTTKRAFDIGRDYDNG